jgi:hypothetical protein
MPGKFKIEYGIHGAAVVAPTERLTVNCLGDGEIDHAIDRLVADLEQCRREMKLRAIKEKDAVVRETFARA